MANEVKILLSAENKASKELQQVDKDLGKFGTQFKSLSSTLLAGAATITAIGVAAKQAFDLGKEGASITQLEESFEGLIAKTGAHADLLSRMTEATRGTVDQVTLMSSAMTLAAGADDEFAKSLLNATPQLAEIAKASNKLNPNLGSTAFLFESINTGIKRGSPLILDNLGITIKMEEAYGKYAASLGKAASELTSTEQKQAILNATLEAGNILIDQAGGQVDSAADSFARLEVATKTITDQLKQELAPSVAVVAEELANLLTAYDKTTTSLSGASSEVRKSANSYDEYIAGLKEAFNQSGYLIEVHGDEIKAIGAMTGSVKNAREEFGVLTEVEFNALKSAEALGETYDGVAGANSRLNAKILETIAAVEEETEATEKDKDALKGLSELSEGMTFAELNKSLEENKGKFDAARKSAEDFYKSLEKLNTDFGAISSNVGAAPAPSSGSGGGGMSAGLGAITVVYSPMYSAANNYEFQQALIPLLDQWAASRGLR